MPDRDVARDAALISGASLMFSLPPVLLHMAGGAASLVSYATAALAGTAVSSGLWLTAAKRRSIAAGPGRIARHALGRGTAPLAFAGWAGYANYFCFVGSARFVDTAVSSAVIGLWPIGLLICLARWGPAAGRDRSAAVPVFSASQKWMIAAAAAGMCLVLESQTAGSVFLSAAGSSTTLTGAGLALAAAALISVGETAATSYGPALRGELGPGADQDRAGRLWCSILGAGLTAAAMAACGFAVSAFAGWDLPATAAAAALAAGASNTAGMVLLRTANLGPGSRTRLGMNAISMSSPGLALAWLLIAGVGVSHVWMLAAGTAAIAAACAGLGQTAGRPPAPAAGPETREHADNRTAPVQQ